MLPPASVSWVSGEDGWCCWSDIVGPVGNYPLSSHGSYPWLNASKIITLILAVISRDSTPEMSYKSNIRQTVYLMDGRIGDLGFFFLIQGLCDASAPVLIWCISSVTPAMALGLCGWWITQRKVFLKTHSMNDTWKQDWRHTRHINHMLLYLSFLPNLFLSFYSVGGFIHTISITPYTSPYSCTAPPNTPFKREQMVHSRYALALPSHCSHSLSL